MPSGKIPGGYRRLQVVWQIRLTGPSGRARKLQNNPALPSVHENKHTINPADFPCFNDQAE